jgi:peptidyl-prolyl cis-trans isomerase D
MSVIQTIRSKYGKLAGGVIGLALVGFIISDARNGSLADFFRGKDNEVMRINGSKIEPREYSTRLKEYEVLYSMFNGGRSLDDATRAQISEQLIQMMIYEEAVSEQCNKLGIQTSDEEKKELIYGMNADPLVRQFSIDGQEIFINPETKQFDPQIIKYMEKQFQEAPQKIDPQGKLREQWDMVKSYVLRSARINKFNAMFAGAVYTPFYITKRTAAEQNATASVRVVKVPYSVIPDAEVKVSDDEMKEYMKKHEAQFKTEQPTRAIEYVSFDIVPSAADTARAIGALEEAKAEFVAAKDNKAFVNSKTDDLNSYSEAYLNKRTFTSRYSDTIMTMPVGEMFGPYYENGAYRLSKITGKQTLPDSSKIRHILVKTKDRGNEIMTDSAAKKRLDSAVAMINAGGKFDSVAAMYSMDEGSAKKGGEYTFTLQQRPNISKEFADFAFEGKTGEKKTVKVTNDNYSGYHYIEILEQNGVAPAVQMATIVKTLAPSDSTVNAIYGKANEFAGRNTTAEQFDATVKKQGLDKRVGDNIKPANFSVQGLGPAREVVRWAYEHKVNEISPVFQLGNDRYVVAKLSSITEKGELALTPANRSMIEQKVREEKKADMIASKFGKAGGLDAIAQASGQTVQQADTVTLANSYINNIGFEPMVVGYIFNNAFQPNAVSPGIKGQGGVYYVTVLNRNAMPMPDDATLMPLLSSQRRAQDMQMKGSIGQILQQTVNKQADVKYNVANF